MIKAILVIPPDYEHTYPPLGTPALLAFLRQKGIDAEQIDLNLRYRDFLAQRISGPSIDIEEKRALLGRAVKKFFVENLKDRYYSPFLPRDTDGIFPYLPYGNNTNSSFYFTERLLSSEHLWRYLEDGLENTFYQFYEEEEILDFLDKGNFGLLGLSIISPSQVIPALTLGFLVKKHLPHIHLCIGGQWPTLYRNALLQKKEFFRCFDSIIVFEGESPLYELAAAIKNNKDISHIPNLISKDGESFTRRRRMEEDLNSLPCPDFDGLPLGHYDGSEGGEITLTYETSRSCYWSKCAYCTDAPLPRLSYRRKNPDLVANDIKQLKTRYNTGVLILSDLGLSPRQMLEISKAILKEGVKIDWSCMARLDHGFNYEIFKLAGRAGLTQVNFGFESASDRICGLLHKGNKKERSLRIIKDCFQAGIIVGLQTMLGLPNEAFSDGLETIDFLIANKNLISGVTFNIYYLTPSNLIYQNPQNYGIKYKNDPQLPFKFFTPFDNLYGISENEAHLLQQLYCSLLKKDKADNKGNGVSVEDALFLPKNVSENWIEFNLNGESCKMRCLRNNETGKDIYFNEKEELIIDCIKKGYAVGDMHSSLAKRYPGDDIDSILHNFIGGAVAGNFLARSPIS